jgi:hypothetical protein
MQNLCLSSVILFLDSKSQVKIHVIIKNRKEKLICIDLERRNIFRFYKNYELIS